MKKAHDTNTPTNIRETTEKAGITAATAVATTTTTNTQPSENVGNVDEQRRHGERQKLI
jgi:hypothetical protein